MTLNEWSTICTIKQEPSYRFVGNEGVVALRMERKCWLRVKGDKTYTVTPLGEGIYTENKDTWNDESRFKL